MKIIPFLKVEIAVDLVPEELLPLLSKKCTGEHSMSGSTEPLVGSVKGNKFKACRAIGYRNSFLPIAVGEIVPTATGSLMQLHLRLPIFTAIFTMVWFSGLLFGLERVIAKGAPITAVFFILILFAVGYIFVQSCFWLEVPKIKRILENVVGRANNQRLPTR